MFTNLLNALNSPAANSAALNLILFVPILAAIFLLVFINDDQKAEARWLGYRRLICLPEPVALSVYRNEPGPGILRRQRSEPHRVYRFFIAENQHPLGIGPGH